jgi:hypothetical protein
MAGGLSLLSGFVYQHESVFAASHALWIFQSVLVDTDLQVGVHGN